MPVAWYIIPYVRVTPAPGLLAARAVALVVDAPTFKNWREVECLGNRAIVKVNASASVLSQLDAAYKRIPKNALDDSLADLSNAAKTALRDELLDMGYTLQEVQNRFGNDLGAYTLRDVLRFMASRRRKPRYDSGTDTIVLDGEEVPGEDIDALDRIVT